MTKIYNHKIPIFKYISPIIFATSVLPVPGLPSIIVCNIDELPRCKIGTNSYKSI